MKDYQRDFIRFAISHKVLCFGEYTLKSGRTSPYFFNAGKFYTGGALAELGGYYAAAIEASGIAFDVLFGPAYKGIPLVSATAVAFANHYQRDVPFCFNRKVVKDHGEGGSLVGAPLQGRIMVIDDVITAGTAFREVASLVKGQAAELVGMVTALDRCERGASERSATQELAEEFGAAFTSIVSLEHVMAYLSQEPAMAAELERMHNYQAKYGVK